MYPLFRLPTEDFWPEFGLVEDVRHAWRQCLESGDSEVALATLVDAQGSTPRRIGSQMVIRQDGSVVGYVSGGCVEGNVAEFAKQALSAREIRKISLGAGSKYVDIKLPCGSRIDIIIDPIVADDPALNDLFLTEDRRTPRAWTGELTSTAHACVTIEALEKLLKSEERGAESDHADPDASKSPLDCGATRHRYWKIYEPKRRLIVNGKDPIALAVATLGTAIGLEVILNAELGPVEPPGGNVLNWRNASAGRLFDEFVPDQWTAIVSTTHDLDKDHEVLKIALPSPCFFVGVLGSRRHLPGRLGMLRREGIPQAAISRLSAPIGLDIGASTPYEIAVAILADVIAHARARISMKASQT